MQFILRGAFFLLLILLQPSTAIFAQKRAVTPPILVTSTSAVKMNVLYIGVSNPLSVKVSSCNSENIKVEIDGNAQLERDAENSNLYWVRVTNLGKYLVTVKVRANNDWRIIGTKEFRAKRIPDPVVTVDGVLNGGVITAENLRKTKGLVVSVKDFDFEAPFNVVSFQMMYTSKGEIFKAETQGADYKDNMLRFLNRAAPNDLIVIDEIKVIGPDSQPRKLGQIAFKIVDESSAEFLEQVLPVQKPKLPPQLNVVSLKYSDTDGNNRLDGGEMAKLSFTLVNSGKGPAYNMRILVKEKNNLKEVTIPALDQVSFLGPGEKKDFSIPLQTSKSLPAGKATFSITITEANGFDTDPNEIALVTQEFLPPKVKVVSYQFTSENGGPATLGTNINLKFIVQNMGYGTAANVHCNIDLPEGIFASEESFYTIGEMMPGESKEIRFGLFGNKKYSSPVIPVKIKLDEKSGYAENTILELNLSEKLSATNKIEVTPAALNLPTIQEASLTSDVDKNIPINSIVNEHRYALVIGNEDYTRYQTTLSSESNVAFAAVDASTFAAYCEKTLGVPKENITLLENAISSKMRQKVEEISKLIQYEGGNAEVIVYYAGHGFPDETTKESYIMPVDVSGANVTEGIKLSDLYKKLTQFPVKRVTVFLDACFSGGGRDAGLLAARAVKIQPKANATSGNLVVLSASSGEQSALPFKDKQHGMFTYYLLKKLQETKGDVLYKDLFDYVKQQVEINSIKVNGKDQNPQLNYSSSVDGTWRAWKVK